jgi:hypothetical protein
MSTGRIWCIIYSLAVKSTANNLVLTFISYLAVREMHYVPLLRTIKTLECPDRLVQKISLSYAPKRRSERGRQHLRHGSAGEISRRRLILPLSG